MKTFESEPEHFPSPGDLPSTDTSTASRSTDVATTLSTTDDSIESATTTAFTSSATYTLTERVNPSRSTSERERYPPTAAISTSVPMQQSLQPVKTSAHTRVPTAVTEPVLIPTPTMQTATELSKLESTPTDAEYSLSSPSSASSSWQQSSWYLESTSSSVVSQATSSGADFVTSISITPEQNAMSSKFTPHHTTQTRRVSTGPTGKAALPTSASRRQEAGTPETQTTGNESVVTIALSVVGGVSFAFLIGLVVFLLLRRRSRWVK